MRTGHQHHDLISYSAILSWHWYNQSLPYPINAKHLTRKQQVSISKSLVWLKKGSNPWVRIPRSNKTGGQPSTHVAIPSGVWANVFRVTSNESEYDTTVLLSSKVMQIANITPRAGFKPTNFAMKAGGLSTILGSLMQSPCPYLPGYALPCLRGQRTLLHHHRATSIARSSIV